MLDATTGRAKLGDLGESHVVQSVEHLARRATRTMIGTRTPFGVGTPWYMAPEMRYQDEEKSGRTDMFSVGVVMCEMSSRTRPNPGPEMARIDKWTSRHVPEEERRAADIALMQDQQLRDIVEHLIVHEMADRWNAKQTLERLQQVMQLLQQQ
jgi:serine/threonine protein kinase